MNEKIRKAIATEVEAIPDKLLLNRTFLVQLFTKVALDLSLVACQQTLDAIRDRLDELQIEVDTARVKCS